MTQDTVVREDLYVPDRFEGLRSVGTGALRTVVVPVEHSLHQIDLQFADMRAAGRGALWVLRGQPGSGKSTFLDTVGLFREGVVTERIGPDADVAETLAVLGASEHPRVIVLEGREALLDVSVSALEKSMHAINTFVRSPDGRDTLIVWPTNTDGLSDSLVSLGNSLGGSALLGIDGNAQWFSGPEPTEYTGIGERTVAALNDGASLAALGVTEARADELAVASTSVGDFLSRLRRELLANGARVQKLMKSEQPHLWVLVIAGNDPEGDVAALTRGGLSSADIDRLMGATGANIVETLKREPDTLGILSTVLDTRILHMDKLTALAVAREYAGDGLRAQMKLQNMASGRDTKALDRLSNSDLGLVLAGAGLGVKRRGSKPGGGTQVAFEGLARIAQANDGLLNKAIGDAVIAAGYADSYTLEKVIGTGVKFYTDIALQRGTESVRIEVMWRKSTSRAEIANYVLTKLGNYAKAIGLLSP